MHFSALQINYYYYYYYRLMVESVHGRIITVLQDMYSKLKSCVQVENMTTQ